MVACSALVRSLAHVLKAERKPWTVVRSASPLSRKELRQRHIRQRLPSPRWGRKGQAAAVGEGPRLFEHGHRRVAQRLAVFNPALHAVRGDAPLPILRVDLIPLRTPNLPAAGCGQHKQLEA